METLPTLKELLDRGASLGLPTSCRNILKPPLPGPNAAEEYRLACGPVVSWEHLEQAVTRTECRFRESYSDPLNDVDAEIGLLKLAAKSFTVRALASADSGRFSEAVSDLAMATKVCRHARQTPSLLALLVATAIEANIWRTANDLMLSTDGNSEVTSATVRLTTELGEPNLLYALRLDWAGGLVITKKHFGCEMGPWLMKVSARLGAKHADLETVRRAYLSDVLGIAEACRVSRFPLSETDDEIQAAREKTGRVSSFPVRSAVLGMLSTLPSATVHVFRAQAVRHMTCLAAQVWQARHALGSFPTSLDQWGGADPLYGGRLGYERSPAGFVIWSKGRNGTLRPDLPRQTTAVRMLKDSRQTVETPASFTL